MVTAYVLMTAMPPTKGHLHLIQFAASLDVDRLRVVVCTQPEEPFARQRYHAVKEVVDNLPRPDYADVIHIHQKLPQDPTTPGFWALWKELQTWYGFKPGDVVVSSEHYGARLAELGQGIFIPYDPNRELCPIKATDVRNDVRGRFRDIMPTFQYEIRQRVTVFGAESTGKTSLSKYAAGSMDGHWLFEWARPYLESVGPEITVAAMEDIWAGQMAAQDHTMFWEDKPFIVQDTDLFSTVGYWEQPHWTDKLGVRPEALVEDAMRRKSDLYLITRSNIPFEPDTIRYGITERESSDEFWIDVADRYGLNYKIIEGTDRYERLLQAQYHMDELFEAATQDLIYDRKGF